MPIYYRVSDNQISSVSKAQSNLTLYKDSSDQEKRTFIKEYNLPKDVFDFDDIPHVAPRIEYIYNDFLGETIIFVFSNIVDVQLNTDVEGRLESHTFILGENQLFWFINNKDSPLNDELFNHKQIKFNSLQSIIMNAGLQAYKNFTSELSKQKEIIEQLNAQVQDTSKKSVLIEISNTEKNLVFLQHTIEIQESTFSNLLDNEEFIAKLDEPHLVHDIKWYNRQVNKLVNVYRDLLDSTSSLFSDIMSNHLNVLMKFLSSLSLVLASTSLVAELWGMNSGGLPFESHPFGTHIMITVAFLSGVTMYILLKRKDYFND